METSLQDTTHMTKKQIRIILACTILLPVWIFELSGFLLFAGWLCFFMGFFVVVGKSIEYLATDDKGKCKETLQENSCDLYSLFVLESVDENTIEI